MEHFTFDVDKCTGCRICEARCSFRLYGEINPQKSLIRISRLEEIGVYVPNFCHQCEEPVCEIVCPKNAIKRDSNSGIIGIDKQKCTFCGLCVVACKYAAISLRRTDDEPKFIYTCDACGGDPYCVKYCATQAITYHKMDESSFVKGISAWRKIVKLPSILWYIFRQSKLLILVRSDPDRASYEKRISTSEKIAKNILKRKVK